MSYVLNEVPAGAVNGVNATYTTAETLYQVVSVVVDGVVYTGDIIVLNNTFTLGDAPTASIFISYYTSANSLPVIGTLTVQTVYATYARFKKDISDVPQATFLDWADWVNKFAYRYIMGVDPERFIAETTIQSVSGQNWAYLPTDFRDIQAFGCGLYFIDSNGLPRPLDGALMNPNANTNGYYIKDDRLYFTPVPNQSNSYQLRYTPIEPTIDALTDTFIAPLDARYIQYLVGAIDVLYDQWDEDIGMEGIADQRFTRLLDELGSRVRQQAAVYNMEDSSQMY